VSTHLVDVALLERAVSSYSPFPSHLASFPVDIVEIDGDTIVALVWL
jgi:hypothetical protein